MKNNLEAFKTERTPIISFYMINHPRSWPKADSAKCSIFEALNIVGEAKFGSSWTNDELSASYWREQPKDAEERRLALERIPRPVRKSPLPESIAGIHNHGRLIVPVRLEQDSHVQLRAQHLSRLSHAQAVADEQARWEENNAKFVRLVEAVEWLAQTCRDGMLRSFYRFQVGGSLAPMDAFDWNVEYPLSTFVAAGGYKRCFLIDGKFSEAHVYIFFDRSEVQAAVQTFASAPAVVRTQSLETLSPYLRFAVKIALEKGYVGPKAASEDVRRADIIAAWEQGFPGVPMTENQVKMLAFVTGWPNPMAIRSGMKATERRKTGTG